MNIDISIADQTATITMHSKTGMNALDLDDFVTLAMAFDDLGADPQVDAIVLTAVGSAFCSGASLDSLVLSDGSPISPQDLDIAFRDGVNRLSQAMITCAKPVVIAVNGAVAGAGLGVALTGDVVIAAQGAVFHCGFVPMLGLVPDAGSSWILPNMLGRNRALAHAVLGDPITAQDAAQAGLIYDIVPAADLHTTAQRIANRLGQAPHAAILKTRALFTNALHQSLGDVLEQERTANVGFVSGPELQEGVRAFRERRTPNFAQFRSR